ncbi:MAG TPA: diacylglycerol kinase family protein [Pyrinomonadaceae bacterium]|jgi:YegS/Rv2252/BmrU family lipid kinase
MSLLPLVIVNPASAAGGTRSSWPRLASDLCTHFGPFNCAFTEKPGDGRRLAAGEAGRGRRLIIACGGDGTVSEVAAGILESGTDAELGILPSGTGGDFRRTLEIPARAADAARTLRSGLTRRMDVGCVDYINHRGEPESRYFLGVASFGMSTDVIERVKVGGSARLLNAASRQLGGKLSFASAMLQTTLALPLTEIFIRLDDRPERRLVLSNLCVANARFFGGGMKIAPGARLNDGRLDIIAVGDLGRFGILANAHRLYRGTHLDMAQVHHAEARIVTARPALKDTEVAIEVDGELPGRLPATFALLPGALRVRCPVGKW